MKPSIGQSLHLVADTRVGRHKITYWYRPSAKVRELDSSVERILRTLGEHGTALCDAFAASPRDENSACAAAMRLIYDRPLLSPPSYGKCDLGLPTHPPSLLSDPRVASMTSQTHGMPPFDHAA
jgi:hypothetical protein